ncbi:MAG: UDP-N-acetylmuramoyl-L-alanine--D-glutamate ligase [Candidatus Roizmanbacteria bacterium]
MTIDELKTYKRICIVGYAMEGIATEKFIKKFHPKASITIADAKDGPDYLDKQYDSDLVIKTPGLPKEYIKVRYTTATNLFFGNIKNKTIGITGTKGKSTTTALVHHLFETAGIRSKLCGNIGIPMLSLLTERHLDPADILCIELSSYQLDDIDYSPHIGVILNVYEEHLDYHGGLGNYVFAKQRIALHMNENDYYLYNPNFPELKDLKIKTKAKMLPFTSRFTISDEAFLENEMFHFDDLAAVDTIADLFDISLDTIRKSISTFVPLPHRRELVGTYKGIRFINDSASSNPASAIFALKQIKNVKTIILGGLDRGYDIKELVSTLRKSSVENVILFPDLGDKLYTHLSQKKFIVHQVDNMKDAVKQSYALTANDSTCLLSPGAPSYNMFSGFPDRGDQFKKWVKELS